MAASTILGRKSDAKKSAAANKPLWERLVTGRRLFHRDVMLSRYRFHLDM
jgi:hypothetical protein